KFRQSKGFADSKTRYAPGWGANDHFADPQFVKFAADWKVAPDLRLGPKSPAVDAGVALPETWPDPLRSLDQGKPDLGAVPIGVEPWRVGVRGRLTAFGEEKANPQTPPLQSMDFVRHPPRPQPSASLKPAAVLEGYPAPDVPLIEFALRRQRV